MAEPATVSPLPIEDLPDLETDTRRVAGIALAEDGPLDITTEVLKAPERRASAVIEFRQAGVLSGTPYAEAVAELRDCTVHWDRSEGASIVKPQAVGRLNGILSELLRVERPLLNLLQRASGIATTTARYVAAVAGTGCRILHTRKTAPGLRGLDVRAVIAGGGGPHRMGLSHTVLVKDNHWALLGPGGADLANACNAARLWGVKQIYVEVENASQVGWACEAGATRVLIDNQTPQVVGQLGELARGLAATIEIEASGGITLANVRDYAEAGAGFVSVGALTHSVVAADVAIEIA